MKIFKKFIIFIIVLGTLILLTEIGCRYYIKFQLSKVTKTNLDEKSYGIIMSDKELGSVHRSHAYNSRRTSNNMGFLNDKDVVLPEKRNPQDKVFIAYGASTTFCYNLGQYEAWPYLLQKKMCNAQKKNDSCKFSVLNSGVVMYSIGHIYKKALKDLPLIKPDYLIIYSGLAEHANYMQLKYYDNIDVEKAIKNKNYGLTTKAYDWWWLKNNLITLKIINKFLVAPLKKMATKDRRDYIEINEKDTPLIFENYIEVLKKFIHLADQYDVKVIFIVQVAGTDTQKNNYTISYSQRAAKIMEELGAIVIDPNEMINKYKGDKKELFIASGVHYTSRGTEMLSEFLINQLRDKRILITN